MGCNCGKKKPHGPRPESFVLTTWDGRVQHFSRRLDAEAARVRARGGDIRVRKASK